MGQDKALLEIDHVPLWRRQIETLRALSPDEIFISGPRFAEWRDFEIVADVQPNAGPLGGIAAALQRCRSDFLVVLAVDMPRMNAAFLRSMLDDCVAANDGRGIVPKSRGGYEPLAAVYPKSSLPVARGCIEEQCYKLQQFVRRAIDGGLMRERKVTPNEEPLFSNLNTPAEFDMHARSPAT